MAVPIYVADAFTDQAFRGNPAGVCILEQPKSDEWMQSVAAEMKHAETAFLRRQADHWLLRWFTPTVEVDLCGHATLASSYVLYSTGRASKQNQIAFETNSGKLTARAEGNLIVLDFPSEPVHYKASEGESVEVAEALGLKTMPEFVGRNRMDWLVQTTSADEVRSLSPDMARVQALGHRGVIVTSADTETDFISRFFAPQSGVDEDPVTGSAHCCLAPFWAERLGREDLTGYQASPRGGKVRVRVNGDRVELMGNAVMVLEGRLLA